MSSSDPQMAKKTPATAGAGETVKKPNHRVVGSALAGLVVLMLGMSYAAVPLYKLFCQVTGYAGTTQRAKAAPQKPTEQMITVRFDANISRDLGWQFKPLQRSMTLKIGEEKLAFYTAVNSGNTLLTGTATFNVTPALAGSYFNKIACFCFTEQTLQPGESVDMPVSFFVDPDILTDPDTKNIKEITLSYTFFEVKKQKTTENTTNKMNGSL